MQDVQLDTATEIDHIAVVDDATDLGRPAHIPVHLLATGLHLIL